MRAYIVYFIDKCYGFGEREEFYIAQVKSGWEGIELRFDFPRRVSSVSGNGLISSTSLYFTRQEAEEVVAVLNSFLHHPTKKDFEEKWISFRGMPQIRDENTLNKIVLEWKKEEKCPEISVINESELHISTIGCSIVYSKSGQLNYDTMKYDIETHELHKEVQLNIAPNESKTFKFDSLANDSKVSSITITKGNGYKIESKR